MKNDNNLFAVSAVRVKENSLLSKSDLEQLINAESYKKAVSLLSEKGYDINENSDYSSVLDGELNETWDYIISSAPEAAVLKAFVVKNDFQNIKAILKSEVMGYDAKEYLTQPCITEKDELLEIMSAHSFDSLPDYLGSAAKKAHEIISTTENAQLCDAYLDTAALETMLALAKENGDDILCEYFNNYCLACDIKTAFRAIKTGKDYVFLKTAIADNALISKDDFINAALGGEEEFFSYLSSADLADYVQAIEKSASAFEKYCDDKMTKIMKKAKMTVFGISPLAAYYVAKETEIKCLRIILSAKQSRVSDDIIRERMRELYV